MSLSQSALRLMAGDLQGAVMFVSLLPDDVLRTFPGKLRGMKDLAYSRMLRDPDEFMRFKIPTPLEPLSVERFRSLVDACLNDQMDALNHQIEGLNLQEAYVIFSSAGRLIEAANARPLLKGAPVQVSHEKPLSQSELF